MKAKVICLRPKHDFDRAGIMLPSSLDVQFHANADEDRLAEVCAMDLIDFLLILAVGLVCGSLGHVTSGFSRQGWFAHTGVALLGATAGVAVSRSFELPVIYGLTVGHTEYPLLWAVLGSVSFVAVLGLFLKPRR